MPKIVERLGAVPLQPTGGRIEMERVTFTYGNQRKPLYADFSLAIAAGERVALVGPSGSGKSTFVKLLQRLYDLDAGRILIDGQDIAGVTLESLRRVGALVAQDPALSPPLLGAHPPHRPTEATRGAAAAGAR